MNVNSLRLSVNLPPESSKSHHLCPDKKRRAVPYPALKTPHTPVYHYKIHCISIMYQQQPQYASTSSSNGNYAMNQNQNQNHSGMGTIAPHETTTQPAQTSAPLVATGDWTKDLVHLAKTAELKCVLLPIRSCAPD